MIKNIALFLASTSLACVIPASSVIAPKTVNNEVLMSQRTVGLAYDGFDFFGDCTVEATLWYEDFISQYPFYRVRFGEWYPTWNPGYFGGVWTITNDFDAELFTYIDIHTESGGYFGDLREYRRTFEIYSEYDDGIDYFESYAIKWRVYQDSPIFVPYAFLEQFLLGLSPQFQGGLSDYDLDLYVYNHNRHQFDNISLEPRSPEEYPALTDSISPASLRSIITSDNRYIYYADENDTSINSVPLIYNGGWVFCYFDLWWEGLFEHGLESTHFLYSNRYATEEALQEVVYIMNNVSPLQLKADVGNLLYRFYGDTIYLEQVNPSDLIFGTVENFLMTEFMPDFSFGDLLLIVLGVMVFGAFLKVFLGG